MDHDLSESTLEEALGRLFGESVTVDNLKSHAVEGGKVHVVDMSYERRMGSDFETSSCETVSQTAIVSLDDRLKVPHFSIRPAPKGGLNRLFKLFGSADIEFEDSPEFNARYQVHGFVEPAIRILLTGELREDLAENEPVNVAGLDSYLVVFRQNESLTENQVDTLIERALPLFDWLRQGEKELDQDPELNRETRPEDAEAFAQRTGGIVGLLLKRQLDRLTIKRIELERFLNQSPPRTIPGGVQRQVIGQNGILVLFGLIFASAGIGMLLAAFNERKEDGVWLLFLLGSSFTLVGSPIAFFTARYRYRKQKLLRRGKLISGTIVEVKRTSTEVNQKRLYHVRIKPTIAQTNRDIGNSQTDTIVCPAYGEEATRAKKAKEKGELVRVLQSNSDPQQAVCPDLLLIWEEE